MIESSAQTIWGTKRRCQGVQTVLIEMMTNTFAHADPTMEQGKPWWLSINHSESEKRVRFHLLTTVWELLKVSNAKGQTISGTVRYHACWKNIATAITPANHDSGPSVFAMRRSGFDPSAPPNRSQSLRRWSMSTSQLFTLLLPRLLRLLSSSREDA